MKFMILLSLALVNCEENPEKAVSIDEISGKKYEFGLFENVDGSRKVYQQEENLLYKLKDIRQKLIKVKSDLEKKIDLPNLGNHLEQLKQGVENLNTSELTSDFPTSQDHTDAVKGIFTLFYAYEYNLTEALLNGNLQFRDALSHWHSISSYEKLDLSDAESMLDLANERQIYGAGVHILSHMLPVAKTMKLKKGNKMMKRLKKKKEDLIKINNGYLQRTQTMLYKNYEVLPYMIDDDLNPRAKQPDFVRQGKPYRIVITGSEHHMDWLTMSVCKMGSFLPPARDKVTHPPMCRYLHHMDPYLKLGPFKEEEASEKPYAVVFHDILSDIEINYLVETARPNLSRKREFSINNSGVTQRSYQAKKTVKIVHKTVQAWIPEVEWPPRILEDINNYVGKNYTQMNHPVLWKLAAKIKLATQLETQSHYSSTEMQVTNYGLGGLCENHIDPHGLHDILDRGEKLPPSHAGLKLSGDMIGTFMAWLSDTKAGGATVFLQPGYENIIMPEKGAAGFWYDMDSSLYRDKHSRHAGCPILTGSKWILNKWMNSYDNFAKFPCKLQKRATFNPPSKSHYY